MSPPRIVVVSPYRSEYGPREVLDHVLRALVLAGYEPICALPPHATPPGALADLGLTTHVVDSLGTVPRTVSPRRLGRFMKDHLTAARGLAEIGRATGARGIYSVSEATLCGSIAARQLHVPGIIHAIGMSIQSPRITASLYIGMLDHLSDHVVACSSAVADMFTRFGVPDSKITVVHNGISVAEVDRSMTAVELMHEGPKIGMVAAYDPRKGHDLFLEAAAEVARHHPTARFYLIGGTLEGQSESVAYELRVEELIGDLRLLEHVVQTGYVPAPHVYDWIRAMDIIVVPSRTEAFAHALLEAMACRKPVIATGIEGNLDAFVHGHSGLYTQRDPRALAALVMRLIDDPAEREALGAAARERVALLFDLAVTVPANAQMLAQLLPRAI